MRPKRVLFLLSLAAILAFSNTAWAGAAPHVSPQGDSFIVNSTADDTILDTVITLREAMLVSEGILTGPFTPQEAAQLGGCVFDASMFITTGCGSGVPDAITFAPSVGTITLSSLLPDLEDTGTTILGNGTLPVIDSINLTEGATFTINGSEMLIRGISIINTPSAYADILVFGGHSVRIDENMLGLRQDDHCDDVARSGAYGIVLTTLDGSVLDNRPSAYISGNTIGCHEQDGILVYGSDYALIGFAYPVNAKPNFIGLDINSNPIPNKYNGINLSIFGTEIPQDNVIHYNIIGNNLRNGILLNDAQRTTIENNWIGLTVLGNTAAPNLMDGVRIQGSQAYDNLIGGESNNLGNVISGNGQCGINILSHAHQNRVLSNLIGLNTNLNGYVPNTWAAVALQYLAYENMIGDWDLAHGMNRIAGNKREGVYIMASSNNTISLNNIIMDNGLSGVIVVDPDSNGNIVVPGAIWGNGGIPIDLGNDGPTPNDPDDLDSGANHLLNYPVVDNVSGTVLSGTVCPGCAVVIYKAVGDPGKPYGGGEYLGRVAAVGTNWSFDLATIPGGSGLKADDIALMAYYETGSPHETSEMRPRPILFMPVIRR